MSRTSPQAHRALVEERRSQILGAAAKVFASKGYERATIADIAKQARVAEGSIYNYFKNKSDLLISLPREVVRLPVQTIGTLDGHGTPEETLTTIAHTIVFLFRKNSHIFRILVSALPSMKKETRQQYVEQVILFAIGRIENYFKEQIRLGVFHRDLQPAFLARAFVGMLIPVVLLGDVLQVEAHSDAELDEIIKMSVRTFLRGAIRS